MIALSLDRSLVQPEGEPRTRLALPSLPACLSRPVAVATHLFPDPTPPPVDLTQAAVTGAASGEDLPTSPNESAKGDPLASATGPTTTPNVSRRQSVATNPLLNFFNRARTSSVPPAIREGEVGGSASTAAPNGQPGCTKLLNNLISQYSFYRVPRNRQFPLSTVLLVGLISFLLGSLLRSLLSPADFVLYSDAAVTATGGLGAGGRLVDGEEHWREIRRLIELRKAWLGDDLVVAVVRRGVHGS